MTVDLVSLLTRYTAEMTHLDLNQPAAAVAQLQQAFSSDDTAALTSALLAAHAAGELTPRQAGDSVWFGRVAKASDTTHHMSIDAVDIQGPGAPHGHPKGEISWCIPLSDEPSFEGATSGWVVLPPGSVHTPTVRDGRMLIVYFLPEGAVDWHATP